MRQRFETSNRFDAKKCGVGGERSIGDRANRADRLLQSLALDVFGAVLAAVHEQREVEAGNHVGRKLVRLVSLSAAPVGGPTSLGARLRRSAESSNK